PFGLTSLALRIENGLNQAPQGKREEANRDDKHQETPEARPQRTLINGFQRAVLIGERASMAGHQQNCQETNYHIHNTFNCISQPGQSGYHRTGRGTMRRTFNGIYLISHDTSLPSLKCYSITLVRLFLSRKKPSKRILLQ